MDAAAMPRLIASASGSPFKMATRAELSMINVEDRSFQVTPELTYTGVNNLELKLRFFMLSGGSSTEFGEKQSSRKLEVYARYYF